MPMKKIKAQFGKISAPNLNNSEEKSQITNYTVEVSGKPGEGIEETKDLLSTKESALTNAENKIEPRPDANQAVRNDQNKVRSRMLAEPNPFLQTKEVFAKARLSKIGYRMRTDYVEILDIIKKIKKGGYTLEAVLDDALTFYFENSEDGKEAIKKAEIFYS